MFGIFKRDPIKSLKKGYHDKLEQAMIAQRKGDIRAYSQLTVEANSLLESIEQKKYDQGK